MKHTLKVTFILILLFFVTQTVGLITVNKYINIETLADGTRNIIHADTIAGPQPEIPQEEKSYTFVIITILILLGTGLLFILIKFRMGKIWKMWFFFAIAMTLIISFNVYVTRWIAITIGIVLAIIRIFRPNIIIHNFTEIFVYTGITILLLPLLNLFSGIFLLVSISVYDMIAVWKSKHMIKLAKFQLESKSFAGLSINYHDKAYAINKSHFKKEGKKIGIKKGKIQQESKPSTAILGGGDIAFPLLFSATVMEQLIITEGLPKLNSLLLSFFITAGAGVALSLLLFYSKKDKFYPAMPFISTGCLVGYAAILLVL